MGTVTPVLKSPSLDPEVLNNYRPISNLSTISKIFEKCALKQLTNHLHNNNLYPYYQSAYRPHHSCETALMKIIDDVVADLSPNTYIIMTLLDFSAAFDTVDHDVLINRLKTDYGIEANVLNWFKSYLEDRSYKVKVNNTLSNSQDLKFGVPQGSILGPILYTLYVNEIETIANNNNIKVHIYADDVQLYTKCDMYSNFSDLKACLNDIKLWANKNFLKLNNKKTQLLCISSKNCNVTKPQYINLMGENITIEDSAKYLGFWIDKHLAFSKQINLVCSQGYWMLRNLWKISSKVTDIALRTQLVHSCILSKLNFCNALYIYLPKKQLTKLDRLLKAGARYVFNICGKKRWQPMTPYLQTLHFLPIHYRLNFKICLMVYKCLNNQAPEYLKCLIKPHEATHNIKTRIDYDTTWLNNYPLEKINYKCRSFRHAAPDIWNKLSHIIRESESVEVFKARLKTYYFELWLSLT